MHPLLSLLALLPFFAEARTPEQNFLGCEPAPELDLTLRNTLNVGDYLRHSSLTTPPVLQVVADRLSRVNQCRDKIWPQNKLLHTPIRMLDPRSDGVYEYNPANGRFEFLRQPNQEDKKIRIFTFQKEGDGGVTVNTLPFTTQMPPPDLSKRECLQENYDLRDFLNANTPKRSLEPADQLTTFTAHENFHNVDQDPANPVHLHSGICKWAHGADPKRNLPPGDEAAIGLLRQNLVRAIAKAYEATPGKERDKHLSAVKGWATKLREYPAAAATLLEIDIGEGSAEYGGIMANAVGKAGCQDPRALRAELLKHVKDGYMPTVLGIDKQAYLIGAVAGFLLDELGNTEWKNRVTREKISPLDVLLAEPGLRKLSTAQTVADTTLERSLEISETLNTCNAKAADTAMARLTDNPKKHFLVQMEKSPFQPSGFIPVKTSAGEAILSVRTSAQGQELTFDEADVLSVGGLCGGPVQRYVAVPEERVAADGKILPADKKFYGAVPPRDSSEKSWNGIPVLCRE